MGFKQLICIYLVIMITVPALWTMVHGESDITDQSVPTPDKTLRSNEMTGSKTDDEVIAREEEAINSDGFSVKERRLLEGRGEKHQFQAEVGRMMNIIINSLYSNSEIFLRELISNASDAIDKIRYLSLTDPSLLETASKLEIKIRVDKAANTITITDTGVGMTKEELINNLGTIAKSGTTEFLKTHQTGADTSLIGQFGVGFYSVYLVADEVTVISKNNADKQYVWTSDAQGTFSIAEDPRGNTLGRGTSIVIHVKEEAEEFLETETLKKLVTKYSEFINYPILMWETSNVSKEVDLTPEEIEQQRKENKAKKAKEEEDVETINLDDTEKEEEEDEDVPTTKTVQEEVSEFKLMNEIKPIWTRNAKDITDEEYNEFYKAFSKDFTDPLYKVHFSAEGEVEFKSLLFIPSKPPANMYEAQKDVGHRGLKLYVRRVFITDEFRDILPKYLSFLRGIVDSDDLPLNVSREMLQESKTLKIIKKKIVRKAIAMFQTLQQEEEHKEQWDKFYENYSQNIKLGVIEDQSNRQRLSELLQFQSSKVKGMTTLQQYVDRMKEGQKQIFHLACDRTEECQTSPLAEKLVSDGYEVLYMVDAIDEYCLQSLERFSGKFKFANIAKDGLQIEGQDKNEEKVKANKEEYSELVKWLKSTLSTNVEKVEVVERLVSAPAALVSGQYGWTAKMESIMRAQALADPKASEFNAPKKTLEINPDHVLIKELNRRIKEDKEDKTAVEIAELLYDTSALTSGFPSRNSGLLVNRILKMMTKSMSDSLPQDVVEEVQNSQPIRPVEPQIELSTPVSTPEAKQDIDHEEL